MAEVIDIRNPDGSVTGVTKDKKLAHRDGDLHGASHIWIWREGENGEIELLLQLRAPQKSSWPNCYDISAAGHLSAGEDYITGAKRELEEELGIKATDEELSFFGWLHEDVKAEFHGNPFHNREISALYAYKSDLDPKTLVLQEEEVSQVVWMPYGEIVSRVAAGTLPNCLRMDEVERAVQAAKEQIK